MRKVIIIVLCVCCQMMMAAQAHSVNAREVQSSASFILVSGSFVSVALDEHEQPVVHTAMKLLEKDLKTVLDCSSLIGKGKGDILIGTLGQSSIVEKADVDLSALKGKKQAFILSALPSGQLFVVGSDSHGTAYGVSWNSLVC